MSHFDMDMMALFGLMLLVGGVSVTFLKEMIIPMIILFLPFIMVWGDDICSRRDRLIFYGDHFDRGGEIVCKDENVHTLLISHTQGWERKGEYLFNGNKGVEILENQCEIINQSEPHCISITTQIIIGTIALIGIFGWTVWMFRRQGDIRKKNKARHERKDEIIQGAKEMAELYKTDPELKEWNEFVGDYFEDPEEYMKESNYIENIEVIPSSEFAKNINQFLDDLSSGRKKEFAILRNNQIDVAVISVGEYERIFTPKNVNEVLKEADITPKSFFSKYAINAIAKTTPCLKKW